MNNRFHLFFLVAAGKKSIVTDPYKPFGKHMHQKHPQKVYSLDCMWDISSTIPVIFYKVSNCLICHSKDPLVTDRYAVCIPSKISDHGNLHPEKLLLYKLPMICYIKYPAIS